MKNRFVEIAKELGWDQIEEGILVFKKVSPIWVDTTYVISFVTDPSYDNFDPNGSEINTEFVSRYIERIGCTNFVRGEILAWKEAILVSDYFYHRRDFKNELIWARKAMKINPDLKPSRFSKTIEKDLK